MILQLFEDSVTKAFKKEFKSSNPFYLPDEYKLCHKLSHGQGQSVQCRTCLVTIGKPCVW